MPGRLFRVTVMRRPFVWISLVLCSIVVIGVAVQLYLIAAWVFGESGALDAHKFVGGAIVHPAEILAFLVGLVGWWGNWRNVGVSFSLALLGTIQVFFAGSVTNPHDGYVHGLHGGLALFVAALAAWIARREARALGVVGAQRPAVG
jgi:hypothetical protein